ALISKEESVTSAAATADVFGVDIYGPFGGEPSATPKPEVAPAPAPDDASEALDASLAEEAAAEALVNETTPEEASTGVSSAFSEESISKDSKAGISDRGSASKAKPSFEPVSYAKAAEANAAETAGTEADKEIPDLTAEANKQKVVEPKLALANEPTVSTTTSTSAGTGTAEAVKTVEPAPTAPPNAQKATWLLSSEFQSRFVNEVGAKVVAIFRTSLGKAVIFIDPPELGRLKVDISVQDTLLKAHITADNPVVRELLEMNLSELKSSLLKQGLIVDELVVYLNDGSSGSDSRSEEDARSGLTGSALDEDESGKVVMKIALSDSEIDIFI
ncbi:MAG: flagellar hook-length control protein FliK, partial [Thermodesulfobacteriota bacterium]